MNSELTIRGEVFDLVEIRMDPNKYPRLKNLPPATAVSSIAEVIGGAVTYAGKQIPQEDIELMAASLLYELRQDHDGIGTANITVEEIGHCVRRALLGLGPEMYGINVVSLYKVICDYCLHEGRDAQVTANQRHSALRKAALKQSGVKAMLDSCAGAMVTQNKRK